MKNIFSIFIGYFLFILIFVGCGEVDTLSNSTGPSTPSNIVLNVDLNPRSTDVGGSVIITVTTLFADNGVPAAGIFVVISTSHGTTASGTTNALGQAFFTVESVNEPTSVTVVAEDIATTVRINVNGI